MNFHQRPEFSFYKGRIIILFLFGLCYDLNAQDTLNYRYENDFPGKLFYKEKRDSLRAQMPDSSVAIIFANPERNRSGDVDFTYHQNADLFYLTGFTEPNSLLLLFKIDQSIKGKKIHELLFVQEKDKKRESWTGRIAGPEGAAVLTGIQSVMSSAEFESLEIPFQNYRMLMYSSLPKGLVNDKKEPNDLYDLVEVFKKKTSFPPANGDDFKLAKMLTKMRAQKDEVEIALMEKAIGISCDGHIEMMKALEPGMTEYQVQAIGEYIFKKEGAESPGYPSICGGGENSCILHYESNRRTLHDGDLILLDMGGEYHGYSADVTRTLPVSGKFTPEQKQVYNLVLSAQDAAFLECAPGKQFFDTHEAAVDIIKKGLVRLGIIDDEKEYKRYFSHGTSHYLGLDVHDVVTYGILKPGNVITVEPGIYIPEGSPCDKKWWNIGVRIEDDILIVDSGMRVLSRKAPRDPEEIENLMKEKSVLGK